MAYKRIAIVGAGLSGLTVGYYIQRYLPDTSITIYESSTRCGGYVQTQNIEGHIFDQGPHTLRIPSSFSSDFTTLIRDLSLEKELITPNKEVNQRYLYLDNALLPLKASSILLSRYGIRTFYPLIKDLFFPKTFAHDMSVYDYIAAKFSPFLASNFLDPLLGGICGGDITELSTFATLGALKNIEKKHASLLKGLFSRKNMPKPKLFSFKKGMQTLTDALALQLKDVIRLNTPITAIKWHNGRAELLAGNTKEVFDLVIAAIPASTVHNIIEDTHLRKILSQFSTAPIAIAHFASNQALLKKPGFGFLIPSSDHPPLLGVIFTSNIFPEQNRCSTSCRLTVMMGGARHKNFFSDSKDDFLAIARSCLKNQLHIHTPFDLEKITILPTAIPQYTMGHLDRVEKIDRYIDNTALPLSLIGSHFRSNSAAKCLEEGMLIAKKLATGQALASIP